MGTGKTSVGKRVAQSLDFHFVDTDEEIVNEVGKSIPQIFEESGEDYFRELETQVLKRVCQNTQQIISTGGGIVIRPENHPILKAVRNVIWLKASPEIIFERVRRSRDRPLLETEDPQQTIRDLLASRDGLYATCSGLTIATDELSLEETIYGVTETARFWQSEGRL